MTTATAPPKTPTQRRFTVEEYYQMAETGVLPEEENVELLDGQIYLMSPIGSEHAACVRRLNRFFHSKIESQALVSVRNPIRLSDISEPEPDLALLSPREDEYATHHPGPDDVLLIVEVADSSLDFDQETKLPLYARAGIAEYWVVALGENQVHAYHTPEGTQYTKHTTYGPDEEVAVAALPSLDPVSVDQILGGQSETSR